MVDVKAHQKKDGTFVRAHKRSDPRSGPAIAAVVTALLLTGAGTGTLGATVTTGGGASSTTKSSSKSERPRSGKLSIKNKLREHESGSCVAHSYGEVQEFFLRNRCSSLRRVMFTAADGKGNEMLVAVSWTDMPTSGTARKLRRLADRHGTGNISDLGREIPALGAPRFTGLNYDSRQSRTTVLIAEVEPWNGSPSSADMDGVATLATSLPIR
ncbi:hypothetical protein [Saccharopolyspora gloriosae]|uniref:hypothetical protein n=1 Tax=Saccharopolyspora gloriosae TaxID=455344 RepID=UPI001FB706BC|nr:hypothetical protein [Saccharopolyspora gloriosae]